MKTLALTMMVSAGAVGLMTSSAMAQEIRFMCTSDGSECDVLKDMFKRYEGEHPGVTIDTDVVPYQSILEGLPVQLAAGEGPDMATVTDLGGLSRYYLDISPYVDVEYWKENFGNVLGWYRSDPKDDGIYGLLMQLTVTGGFINRTLFDQAKVEVPAQDATWDEWAEASRKVAEATGTTFPMAIDRSGHRIAGPAISYGAKYFDEQGNPVLVDDGFTRFVQQFVDWNKDGTMAREVWASLGGNTYRDAAQEFVNGELVFYYSGSWQTGRFDEQIGDFFDWQVVGSPCEVAACTGMPGGTSLVGFKHTKHPEIVADLLSYIAQEANYAEFSARTRNLPAHKGVSETDIEYEGASDATKAAMKAWTAQIPRLSPIAYAYQGYVHNRAMFNISVQRISQAIVGELTVEEAMERARKDLAQVLAEVE